LPDEDAVERLLLAADTSLDSSEPTLSAPVEAFEAPVEASVERSEPTFFRSSLVLLEQAAVLTKRAAPSMVAAAMRRLGVNMAWRYPHVPSARQQEIGVTRKKPPLWAMDPSGGFPVRWQLCAGGSSSES
jgi:hypothetical protein